MPNRLAGAISPYLRSHADNPVDWWPWGPEAFEEARRRQVPVMVSIGYATCHWCHVMARESFSDPAVAAHLNANLVSVKVDREEHPDVDSSYMAAASAFTGSLGWPLTVFTTPDGKPFYAGTYFPPVPVQGHPAFTQVVDAVLDAWRNRREQAEANGAAIASALTGRADPSPLPSPEQISAAAAALAEREDRQHGGFGGAPKFPIATVLLWLLDLGVQGNADAGDLAVRTLDAMAASPLRDPVEGGFFRYAVQRDWSEPHYERMLYDNALLLRAYARAGRREVASGVAGFLLDVLRLPDGVFASAQDSESVVDGQRTEGGYYALDARRRAQQSPPALDDKVLTGWNGLAIEALAEAGDLLGRDDWVEAARRAADRLLATHLVEGRLVRASSAGRLSPAAATLEDHGMLSAALLRLAVVTGEVEYAATARKLLDAVLAAGDPFAVPGGGDPVLAASGLALAFDPSEGAYPSGVSATSAALVLLHALTGERRYREAATAAMALLGAAPVSQPASFGAALSVLTALARDPRQLVVVTPDRSGDPLAGTGRRWQGGTRVVVTPEQAQGFAAAGFELLADRGLRGGQAAAYLCTDFVCSLPVTAASELEELLRAE